MISYWSVAFTILVIPDIIAIFLNRLQPFLSLSLSLSLSICYWQYFRIAMAVVGAAGIFFCLWVAILGWLATRNPNGCFSVKFYRFDVHARHACAGKRALQSLGRRVCRHYLLFRQSSAGWCRRFSGRITFYSSFLVDRWSVRVSGDAMCEQHMRGVAHALFRRHWPPLHPLGLGIDSAYIYSSFCWSTTTPVLLCLLW